MILVLLSVCLAETRPSLTWYRCTTSSGCTSVTGSVVVDIGFRSSPTASMDYANQLGVTTSGNSLSQKFVTEYNGVKIVGSRLYLLSSGGSSYESFTLVNKELTYDVDLSQIPCGMNAAFFFVEMPLAGGTRGAVYGDGYCDSGFTSGTGCAEFDVLEANTKAAVFTSHACSQLGQGTTAGGDSCQADGCDFNAYRYGDKTFFGPGSSYTVDSTKKFSVVTQFLSTDGTDSGDLREIRRIYIQNGVTIQNSKPYVYNTAYYDSLNDRFCATAGYSVTETTSLKQLGRSFKQGHVLTFWLYDSQDAMNWLDAGEHGPCPGYGDDTPSSLEANYPNVKVTYSNIRYGDLESTH